MRKIGLTLLTVLCLLAGLLYSVVYTEFGLRQALRLIPTATLQYQTVHGALATTVSFKRLRVRVPDIAVSASHADITFNPWALLHRDVNVRALKLSQANVTYTPTNTSNQETPLQPWRLHIHHLIAHDINLTAATAGTHHIDQLTAEITYEQQRWYVKSQLAITTPQPLQTNLTLTGTPQHYTTAISIQGPTSHFQLTGHGDQSHIQLKTTQSKLLSGHLRGDLNLQFSPLRWQTELHARQLQLQQVGPRYPHALSISLTSQGHQTSQHQLNYHAQLAITDPHNHLTLEVQHDTDYAITWNTQIKRASSLIPTLQATFSSQGSLVGTPSQFHTSGSYRIDHAHYQSWTVQHSHGQWNLQQHHQLTGNASIASATATYQSSTFHDIHAEIHGSPKRLQFQGKFTHQHTTPVFSGTLQQEKNLTHITLNSLSISHRQHRYTLTHPFTATLHPFTLHINDACLAGEDKSQACLSGRYHKQGQWQGKLVLAHMPIDNLSDLLLAPFQSNITINSTLDLNGNQQHIQAVSGHYQLTPGFLRLDPQHAITLQHAQGKLNYQQQTLSSTVDLVTGHGNHLQASTRLTTTDILSIFSAKQVFTAQLSGQLPNLTELNSFFSYPQLTQGVISLSLQFNGSISRPNAAGSVDLNDIAFTIPRYGLMVSDLSGTFNANKNKLLTTLHSQVNQRPVTVTASTELSTLDTTAQLTGKDILVYDTSEFTIYASPTLTAIYHGDHVSLNGTIHIPHGNIEPHQFNSTTQLPMTDIVFAYPEQEDQTFLPIALDLAISFGDDLTINTNGITGHAGGSVEVTKTVDQAPLLTGTLNVRDGYLHAFGRRLILKRNSGLQYDHTPIDSPYLAISAYQRITNTAMLSSNQAIEDKQIIGINLTGALSSPSIHYFSTPSTLTDNQIISLLLFGYAVDSMNDNNQNYLAALSAIQLTESGLISPNAGNSDHSILQALGISELTISDTTETDALGNNISGDPQSSFIIGRNFGKHVYLRFSRNFSSEFPTNEYLLRYLFNQNWIIQGTQINSALDSNSGVDALYRFYHD